MIYGYCRISTQTQSIERQIRNILHNYPNAEIVHEAYTGTKINRPLFSSLLNSVREGDTIVFDSVSRMSRNSEEGLDTYFDLFDKGVNLVFLKEPYINTDTYKDALNDKVKLTGSDVDEILKGLNNYFRIIARTQIRMAFEQSQKEVDDLRQRTKEGMLTARYNGKQIGQIKGTSFNIKKKAPAKKKIFRLNKDFKGTLNDNDTMKVAGISRNTFYKYKKELKNEINCFDK